MNQIIKIKDLYQIFLPMYFVIVNDSKKYKEMKIDFISYDVMLI